MGGNLCQSFLAHSFTPTCPRPPQWLSDCTCRVTTLAFGKALHSACDCLRVGITNIGVGLAIVRVSLSLPLGLVGLPWILCRHGARDSVSGPNPLRRICALWTPVLRVKFWLPHGRVQSRSALVSRRHAVCDFATTKAAMPTPATCDVSCSSVSLSVAPGEPLSVSVHDRWMATTLSRIRLFWKQPGI